MMTENDAGAGIRVCDPNSLNLARSGNFCAICCYGAAGAITELTAQHTNEDVHLNTSTRIFLLLSSQI